MSFLPHVSNDVPIGSDSAGTGKTTTLVEYILQEIPNKVKLLISADSNKACDTIALKVPAQYASEGQVIRVGNMSKIDEQVGFSRSLRPFMYAALWTSLMLSSLIAWILLGYMLGNLFQALYFFLKNKISTCCCLTESRIDA